MAHTRGVVVALLLVVIVVGCTDGGGQATSAPDRSADAQLELRAATFASVCREVLCLGSPIYAPQTTEDALRDAIVAGFTDEVEYITDDRRRELTGTDGLFADGGTFIDVGNVYRPGPGDVAAVDVWVSRGFGNEEARTVLFQWDGETWREAAAGDVGVTVTTSVS